MAKDKPIKLISVDHKDETAVWSVLSAVENIQEYTKWANKIPAIKFPADWKVQIIPPFGGAIVRFTVERDDSKNKISVYLDCYDRLGYVGHPYWELYPYKGDTYRCGMEDIDELLDIIEYALGNKRKRLNRILTEKS
ncbi:MAG: hypothetical protein GYA51_16600 [Candidatus Methanofastidiosa archaeon]|nr:hypothetical protein [Candidatus Methanofastidiosa archaeon]